MVRNRIRWRFFDSISSIAVGVKLKCQADVVDSVWLEWFKGLTCEFAGVFEGDLAKKIRDGCSALTLGSKGNRVVAG